MSDRTYYYVKPKPQRGISYRRVALKTPEEAEPTLTPPKKVLDFDFPVRAVKKSVGPNISIATRLGRLAGLGVAVVLLYLSGSFVSAQAEDIKTELSNTSQQGVGYLQQAAGELKDKNFAAATKSLEAAQAKFQSAQSELADFGQSSLYLSGLGNDSFQLVTAHKLVDIGLNLSGGGKDLVGALAPITSYFNTSAQGSPLAQGMVTDIVNLVTTHQDEIASGLKQIDHATQVLDSIDTSRLSPQYRDMIASAQIQAGVVEDAVLSLGTIVQALPDILGYKAPRQYALLNQNQLELRATGGFIGTFTLLDLYQGKVEKVNVDISQRVDGQNQHSALSLPEPLRKVTTTFGTRDSNWYFDFAQSAKTFQKLYEEAGGGTNDGLIAINPTVIQDLLRLTGPITIEGSKDPVTADNFLALTSAIGDPNDQHKDVLKALAPVMLNTLLGSSQANAQKLGELLLDRIRSKDIILYFKDPKLETALQRLNVGGGVLSTSGDYLAVVRSNLGGYKSSGSVTQDITLEPTLDLSNHVSDNLTLTYTHKGKNISPDGPNKDYVRIFVPKGSRLINLTGADYGVGVDQSEESGKTIFGFWLTTNPGEIKTVTINYEPKIEATDNYSIVLQKQPGAQNTHAKVTLKRSAGRIIKDDLSMEKELFNGELVTDIFRSIGS